MNLLLYATNPKAPAHEAAVIWLENEMNSGEPVALPWATLVSFLRLSTKSPARNPAFSMTEALEFVADWVEWESVWIPEPTDRHFDVMSKLLTAVPRTAMVSDAHLAALAIEHGLTLCSADMSFRMFPGLKFHNPLS